MVQWELIFLTPMSQQHWLVKSSLEIGPMCYLVSFGVQAHPMKCQFFSEIFLMNLLISWKALAMRARSVNHLFVKPLVSRVYSRNRCVPSPLIQEACSSDRQMLFAVLSSRLVSSMNWVRLFRSCLIIDFLQKIGLSKFPLS